MHGHEVAEHRHDVTVVRPLRNILLVFEIGIV